ncbi:ribosomal biogenesis factor [Lampetra fluviatilis]
MGKNKSRPPSQKQNGLFKVANSKRLKVKNKPKAVMTNLKKINIKNKERVSDSDKNFSEVHAQVANPAESGTKVAEPTKITRQRAAPVQAPNVEDAAQLFSQL